MTWRARLKQVVHRAPKPYLQQLYVVSELPAWEPRLITQAGGQEGGREGGASLIKYGGLTHLPTLAVRTSSGSTGGTTSPRPAPGTPTEEAAHSPTPVKG